MQYAEALREVKKAEAEAAYSAALDAARKSADKEREKRLKAGEADAKSVQARASGPDFKAAVDTLLANFERHVQGK